ncbi:MAG TPA: phage baseplate assembly protein V, partial [Methanosarcinales archaeon]|nr:phage baseplate assembly protein V [Methanosarcinales archaeon]
MKSDYSLTTTDSISGIGTKKSLQTTRENFSKSHDIFPAKVVTLKDPYRSGNIGVKITGVHAEDVDADNCLFAPMLMPFGGGDNYGFFSMPPIGSDVMVTFIDGDLKNPIILGAWQSRKMISKTYASENEIAGVLGSGSKARALNTTPTDLTNDAKTFLDNKQNFDVNKLTADAQTAISGFASGQLSDLIKGNIGQIPGVSSAMSSFSAGVESVAGEIVTEEIDQLADAVKVPSNSLAIKLSLGQAQVTALTDTLDTITSSLFDFTNTVTTAMDGAPGLITMGLTSLKSDLLSGALGADLKTAIDSVNPAVKDAILNNIDSVVASGLNSTTAFSSVSNSIDTVLKSTKLAGKINLG